MTSEHLTSPSQPELPNEIGTDILESCRLYRELHVRHQERGIPAEYDGFIWKVMYWPEVDGVEERLSITQGDLKSEYSVSFTVGLDGLITKYDVIQDRAPDGKAIFDLMQGKEVTERGELTRLQGAVTMAHSLSS